MVDNKNSSDVKRPVGVIVIFILMILNIVMHIVFLFAWVGLSLFAHGMGAEFVLWELLIDVGFPLLIIFEIIIAIKFFVGKNWSRIAIIIIIMASILYGFLDLILSAFNIPDPIYLIANLDMPETETSNPSLFSHIKSILYLGLDVFIVIYLIFSKKAKEYFGKNTKMENQFSKESKTPMGIKLIAFLMILFVLLQMFYVFFKGVLLLTLPESGLTLLDLGLFLFVIFEIFVIVKFFMGKSWARIILIILLVLYSLYLVWSLIDSLGLEYKLFFTNFGLFILIVFVVFYLLFNKKVKEFFGK